MNSIEICYFSVGQLGRLIRRKKLSPVEVVEAHLQRIESLEPTLNSFLTLLSDEAMRAARKAEREIRAGQYRGPLHGIPFALKDLYYVKGIRNTSGTKIFDTFVPSYDSTVAARFKQAGAILLGKLNMHPLAYGPTGENMDYGPMHNPWNPELITGGSSGGSGSAVAAGQCPLAMGSDTGGSIRIPGALCGIVGFKPTYGRLSRYGVVPLAWSQDHAGPMARTVEDCALTMNALAGYDPKDATSLNVSLPNFVSGLNRGVEGLRIGVIKEFFDGPIDPEVKEVVTTAIGRLRKLGARVSEISWPMVRYAMAIASTIQMVEATACHNQLIRVHGHELDSVVRLRLESGFFIPATDYVQSQRARTVFYNQSLEVFKKVDLLAGPTLPVTAFKIGTTEKRVDNQVMNVIPLLTQYTRPFNLNGFPAITVPCGFSGEGLPVGLQLAGRPFDETSVLRAAHAYEQATEWHRKQPPL
jgi:aspartyl-tRNA(Asn)/glutamyl-tRNA(Gln) amidotransferase subunit A